jgi:hypothetical protein
MTAGTGSDPETYTVHGGKLRTLDTLPRVGIRNLAHERGRYFWPGGKGWPLTQFADR